MRAHRAMPRFASFRNNIATLDRCRASFIAGCRKVWQSGRYGPTGPAHRE
jgi:hypothetical protein